MVLLGETRRAYGVNIRIFVSQMEAWLSRVGRSAKCYIDKYPLVEMILMCSNTGRLPLLALLVSNERRERIERFDFQRRPYNNMIT